MKKYYYEYKLANQNLTAKANVAWVADITTLKVEDKIIFVFLCIDIHTNTIIAHVISRNVITSAAIRNVMCKAISTRFTSPPCVPVILHTDRGTQFSSKTYNNFIKKYQKYVSPSMSRQRTPTDNSVAERFMRTFKNHRIQGLTLEQALYKPGLFKRPRRIINMYVKSLNNTPNKKSLLKAAKDHDMDVSAAAMLMIEPKHNKAFSERFGNDVRVEEVERFKQENNSVISILQEFAAKQAEVVEKTPFDDFESSLALKLIDDRLQELYSLVKSNPEQVRQYVEEAIEPMEEQLVNIQSDVKEVSYNVKQLLPKNKQSRQVQPLRDPIDYNLYPLFMVNAGGTAMRRKDLKRAQLRVAYTILYHVGFRLNEIRHLTQEDIQKAIQASQFSVIHHKTKQAHIHVLSSEAVQDLKNLTNEYDVIFDKYKYKYLFGKEKPILEKSLIRIVNEDLKYTCQVGNIPYNIKSHSFRVNFISSLLKVTSVQNTADIIGHDDIRSTMSYRRYALSKTEIQKLLEEINQQNTGTNS